jgi:hypothetical protein
MPHCAGSTRSAQADRRITPLPSPILELANRNRLPHTGPIGGAMQLDNLVVHTLLYFAGIGSANLSEWLIHKYFLHLRGRNKGGFWSFHWREHHANVRKNAYFDPDYQRSVFGRNAQAKEAALLLAGGLAQLPLLPFVPAFVFGIWTSTLAYYVVHKKSHLDPDWGRRFLPWHVDHHMAPDQDANWCVTFPLWDWILGTRKPWLGTPQERWPPRRAASPRDPDSPTTAGADPNHAPQPTKHRAEEPPEAQA